MVVHPSLFPNIPQHPFQFLAEGKPTVPPQCLNQQLLEGEGSDLAVDGPVEKLSLEGRDKDFFVGYQSQQLVDVLVGELGRISHYVLAQQQVESLLLARQNFLGGVVQQSGHFLVVVEASSHHSLQVTQVPSDHGELVGRQQSADPLNYLLKSSLESVALLIPEHPTELPKQLQLFLLALCYESGQAIQHERIVLSDQLLFDVVHCAFLWFGDAE